LIPIVDDDLSVRRALRRLVQSAGYTVATFASARELLESPDRPSLPIILITALDEVTTLERFGRSGVTGLLCKPFDEGTLLHAIRRALDQGPIDRPDGVR
jgi:FixJ family two-component response regulator